MNMYKYTNICSSAKDSKLFQKNFINLSVIKREIFLPITPAGHNQELSSELYQSVANSIIKVEVNDFSFLFRALWCLLAIVSFGANVH